MVTSHKVVMLQKINVNEAIMDNLFALTSTKDVTRAVDLDAQSSHVTTVSFPDIRRGVKDDRKDLMSDDVLVVPGASAVVKRTVLLEGSGVGVNATVAAVVSDYAVSVSKTDVTKQKLSTEILTGSSVVPPVTS